MTKTFFVILLSALSAGVYSQDSMNKKMDNKTDKMNKKMDNPNDPMNKKIGNTGDTTRRKPFKYKSDSLRVKPARKQPK